MIVRRKRLTIITLQEHEVFNMVTALAYAAEMIGENPCGRPFAGLLAELKTLLVEESGVFNQPLRSVK